MEQVEAMDDCLHYLELYCTRVSTCAMLAELLSSYAVYYTIAISHSRFM